jgi:hypothetical protein
VHDPEKHALGLDPMGGYRFSERIMYQRKIREHVPEKHALGLDPMGGNRFSEKDM